MSETPNDQRIGVIVVDHGSRRAESNEMLEELTRSLDAPFDDPPPLT